MNMLTQIKQLETMSIKELKARYLEVFGNSKGIQNNKIYLIKCLAYKIQENALGGLDTETSNEITKLIDKINPMQALKSKVKADSTSSNTKQRKMPLPGTIIRKNYKGNLLEVRVLDNGFEFNNKVYKSLSSLAKEITGVHCSGFAFFKL